MHHTHFCSFTNVSQLKSISFQNHGYAVSGSELPKDWQELFINENDKSNEGLVHSK